MKKCKNVLKIVASITIIICVILLVRYAWAKYISELGGRAEADVAQFNFNLTGGTMQENKNILFALTRNDENTQVADTMLAPGTSGEFKIGIDASRK